MKKILAIFILFFGLILPAQADDNSKTVLPSETGIVENIKYEDAQGLNQGEETTKQVVTVRVLTGKFKNTERLIDNMLTGNPAYDINLSKGDKVVLHLEPLNDTVSTPDDVDIFIADIQRDNSILYFYSYIFCVITLYRKEKRSNKHCFNNFNNVSNIFYANANDIARFLPDSICGFSRDFIYSSNNLSCWGI